MNNMGDTVHDQGLLVVYLSVVIH